MKKKVVILLSVTIILLLIIGGVFLWPYCKQVKIEKEIEKLADFVVKETSEGKKIEFKEGKFRLEVPEGWSIRKEEKNMIGPIFILNPELLKIYRPEEDISPSKLIKDSFESKDGCLIIIGYIEEEKSIEEIEEETKELMQNITLISENAFELREKNGYKCLLRTSDTLKNGYWIDFLIPTKNKIYTISTVFNRNNKEKCSQKFDKLLETVLIE